MPVEIKELVIRMTSQETNNTPVGTAVPAAATAPTAEQIDQEAIIEACVKQVLTILEQKKKR